MSERHYRMLQGAKGGAKYRNVPTKVDGLYFPSTLEARRYAELKSLQQAGVVRFFIRQPSFDLPGGLKYRADFLVVFDLPTRPDDPKVVIEDCKGAQTPVFKMKRRLFAVAYPKCELRLLTARDVR